MLREREQADKLVRTRRLFQWAPTLGGECYHVVIDEDTNELVPHVSMGTHPWG